MTDVKPAYMQLDNLHLDDLISGEGEWQNIQVTHVNESALSVDYNTFD